MNKNIFDGKRNLKQHGQKKHRFLTKHLILSACVVTWAICPPRTLTKGQSWSPGDCSIPKHLEFVFAVVHLWISFDMYICVMPGMYTKNSKVEKCDAYLCCFAYLADSYTFSSVYGLRHLSVVWVMVLFNTLWFWHIVGILWKLTQQFWMQDAHCFWFFLNLTLK